MHCPHLKQNFILSSLNIIPAGSSFLIIFIGHTSAHNPQRVQVSKLNVLLTGKMTPPFFRNYIYTKQVIALSETGNTTSEDI